MDVVAVEEGRAQYPAPRSGVDVEVELKVGEMLLVYGVAARGEEPLEDAQVLEQSGVDAVSGAALLPAAAIVPFVAAQVAAELFVAPPAEPRPAHRTYFHLIHNRWQSYEGEIEIKTCGERNTRI